MTNCIEMFSSSRKNKKLRGTHLNFRSRGGGTRQLTNFISLTCNNVGHFFLTGGRQGRGGTATSSSRRGRLLTTSLASSFCIYVFQECAMDTMDNVPAEAFECSIAFLWVFAAVIVVSACLYTYTYIHTCMHAYIHTCIHTYVHTYIHACMHTYIHA